MTKPTKKIFCEKCGALLNPKSIVWLTLNNYSGTYTNAETVPDEYNQGAFPFGKDCAKQALAEHTKEQLRNPTP